MSAGFILQSEINFFYDPIFETFNVQQSFFKLVSNLYGSLVGLASQGVLY